MDFPNPQQLPLFISTLSRWGAGWELRNIASTGTGAAQSWTTANRALYVPVTIPWAYPVNRVWWINGSIVTGNADFGIYTPSGARIYSTGSTAQSGASAVQYVTPTTPFVLPPGMYYFAWGNNGTTNRAFGPGVSAAQLAAAGVVGQDTAFPLPAAWTISGEVNSIMYPMCGVTRTISGF